MGQALQHDVTRPPTSQGPEAAQAREPGRTTQVQSGDPEASAGRRRGSLFGTGVPWGANNGKPSGPKARGSQQRIESPLGKDVAHAGAKAGHAIQKSTMRPGGIAQQGFTGTARRVPFQEEMEQSFGADFSGVKVYADAGAKQATEKLGASAYVVGNKIAFNTSSPDRSTVAHELTHVHQHTGRGGARPASGNDSRGIDMAGEHEAEAVESAVSGGKHARSALSGAAPASPTTSRKRLGPARKAAGGGFSAGLTFSPDDFKSNFSYPLWGGAAIEMPTPAPGVFMSMTPSVSISCDPGVRWDDAEDAEKGLEVGVNVSGSVSFKLSLGSMNANVAAAYGEMVATVSGGFTYNLGKDAWSLKGDIHLASDFGVGVSIAGGIIDYKFQFGHFEIASLLGIRFGSDGFSAGAFDWGSGPKEAFSMIQEALNQASSIATAGITAASDGVKYVSREFHSAAEWTTDAYDEAIGGVGAVVSTVTDAAGDAAHASGKVIKKGMFW
jgi:hypothetical protein